MARSILSLVGYLTLRCERIRHPLQYAVLTLYSRDQFPGVLWGVYGDGAVFYGAGMRSEFLGRFFTWKGM